MKGQNLLIQITYENQICWQPKEWLTIKNLAGSDGSKPWLRLSHQADRSKAGAQAQASHTYGWYQVRLFLTFRLDLHTEASGSPCAYFEGEITKTPFKFSIFYNT
jgi:hypothetical protein